MAELHQFHCVACRSDSPRLNETEIKDLITNVPEWQVMETNDHPMLRRTYKFKDFRQALDFTRAVGLAAEQEDHHPTLLTEWGKVTVTWWTHKINGLHQNDFIMAAKTDQLYSKGEA